MAENGFIPCSTLADVYATYCKRFGVKACGNTKLALALKRAIPNAVPGSPRIGKDRTKTRGYWKIPLDVPDKCEGEKPNVGNVVSLPPVTDRTSSSAKAP
jgi:hypothetical protein